MPTSSPSPPSSSRPSSRKSHKSRNNDYGTTPSSSSSQNPESIIDPLHPTIRRYLGSFLILLAELFVSLMHLITRYLQISLPEERRLHPLHLTLIRSAPTVLYCIIAGWYWQRIPYMPWGAPQVRDLLWLRGLGGFVGIVCFFAALGTLPLPDATVISFLTPTFVAIACSLIPALREPFTTIERLGTIGSLLGVILIAQPTFIFGPQALSIATTIPRFWAVVMQLTGVLGAATAYTAIRWIGDRAHHLISMLYFSLITTVGSAVGIWLLPGVPSLMMPKGWFEWSMIAGLAFTGFVVQWALTKGLQLEKAGRGLQMMYVQLVFAGVFEWAVWGGVMKGWRAVGAVVVLVSVGGVHWWKEHPREEREDEERALMDGE